MVQFTTDLPHPYNKVGDGPEGPEARTVADKLRATLSGKTIIAADKTLKAKTVGWEFLRTPITITTVRSYGKKVILDLSNKQSETFHIVVSLGMTGRLQYTLGNHSHIRFQIGSATQKGILQLLTHEFDLYFDDTRLFGNLDIVPAGDMANYFQNIGPDLLQAALSDNTWISKEDWLKIYRKKRPSTRAIHDLLTDQSYVSGMGWYLITDILYYAGIHPERANQTLTDDDWERIRLAAHQVIRLSYAYGGFTIESFISPDGAQGVYPAAIYGKKNDSLGYVVINKSLKNGRTCHFVAEIQK